MSGVHINKSNIKKIYMESKECCSYDAYIELTIIYMDDTVDEFRCGLTRDEIQEKINNENKFLNFKSF